MNPRGRRSTGVRVLAPTIQSPESGAWERFEDLYRSSRDDVYAYVVTLLRDRAAAEDVTAIAFERAYRRRRSFDKKRGDERGWLFGIARNAALDELRRRRRTAMLRRTAVHAALNDLSARERELIALKFHAGLSNSELASVLGVSESNAGTMLHRAIQKLRSAVNGPV
jgi:DNA-directed RNA polymerase specialized sigma24 family protein